MDWKPWPLLCLLALAGCAEDATPVEEDEHVGIEDQLQVTDDTGIIRGVIVDPAVVPVPGVRVAIQNGPETTSNDAGAFGFDGLEPGTYFLVASKAGFNTTQTSVTVVAGEEKPPVVRIQMQPDASTQPYVQPLQFNGYLRCSLSYIALCGVEPSVTGDNFLATFTLDGVPDWINMEAIWESTQPTGDQLNMNMGRTPAGPGTTCCTAQGPSPLLITANATVIRDGGIGSEGDLVHRMFAWEVEGTGIDDHTGQCVPAVLTTYCQGPGVVIDQTYEVFVHTFYHFTPPEDYRFSRDGPPVTP